MTGRKDSARTSNPTPERSPLLAPTSMEYCAGSSSRVNGSPCREERKRYKHEQRNPRWQPLGDIRGLPGAAFACQRGEHLLNRGVGLRLRVLRIVGHGNC